jgi:ABC-type phosphate transport system auxiliary subunit
LRLGGRAAVESGSAGDGQGGAAVARLEEELGALRTRAERAEYRERAHQDRWASEVHALRQRVTELEGQLSQLPALRAALERTALALRAAESRLAEVDRR